MTEIDMETPADRLRTAATRVRRGWTRGLLVNETGQRCALGAILNAQRDVRWPSDVMGPLAADPIAWAAVVALHHHLRYTDGEHHERMFFADWRTVDDVEEWNDWRKQTADGVAATMEKAAAAYEERA
jgi:hypothetical protein